MAVYKTEDCVTGEIYYVDFFSITPVIGSVWAVKMSVFRFNNCAKVLNISNATPDYEVQFQSSSCLQCLISNEINIILGQCVGEESIVLPPSSFEVTPISGQTYYICQETIEGQNCRCYIVVGYDWNPITDPVLSLEGPYNGCDSCDYFHTPRSGNTESFVCEICCPCTTGETINSISPPHPVWTDGYGLPVTQLNMVVLGGENGLNN